jgi:hypothetical protein
VSTIFQTPNFHPFTLTESGLLRATRALREIRLFHAELAEYAEEKTISNESLERFASAANGTQRVFS